MTSMLFACGEERRHHRGGDGDGGGGASSTSGVGGSSSTSTSSGAGGAQGGPAQLCVDLINGYRASLGLPAYTRWQSGEACADSEAQSDGETGQAHGAFGQCGEWAQNECPGWPGPPDQMIGGCLDLMWAEGPGGGHYENMASQGYTEAACGFYTFPDGSVWAVQNFR